MDFQISCCGERSTFTSLIASHLCTCIMAEIWNTKMENTLIIYMQAFAPVGALLGGPIAGWIADHWGRKPALLLAGIPYLVGYLMIALAHLIGDAVAFKTVLLIGRLLSGVGLGWSCMAVPVS